MKVPRKQLLIAVGLALSCKEPARETDPAPDLTEEWEMSRRGDEVVSGDGFVFGAPDEKGFTIGLAVDNPELRVGERLRYRVAVRNTSSMPKSRVLWSNFEDDTSVPTFKRRAQLGIREPGGVFSSIGTAVGHTKMIGTVPATIAMALEPGQMRSRQGNSLALEREGEFEVVILFGGPEFRFSSQSGVVRVRASP